MVLRRGFEEAAKDDQDVIQICLANQLIGVNMFLPVLSHQRKLKMNFWKMRFFSETDIFKFQVFNQLVKLGTHDRPSQCD